MLGQQITLAGSELALSSEVTIDGDINGDDVADITVSGDNASRVFNVVGGAATLDALYNNDLRSQIPNLFPRVTAATWSELPTHPATRSYFQPYSGIGLLANFMESLAALKELLFALGAGLYLIWAHLQRVKQRERDQAAQAEKDRLDVFLSQTIRIEREYAQSETPELFRSQLTEVTELKLRALEELTNEELRGDVNFSIFLQQCAHLTLRIETKLRASQS